MIICDTGPLVAAAPDNDDHHHWSWQPQAVQRTPSEVAAAALRMRVVIASGVVVLLGGFTVAALASGDWVAPMVLAPFVLLSAARVWLMKASRQPVSYFGTVVILINGPASFIASSKAPDGIERR